MEEINNTFKEEAKCIGLTVNSQKTKYYTTSPKTIGVFESLHSNAMEYLGIPISCNQSIVDNMVNKYIQEIYKEGNWI